MTMISDCRCLGEFCECDSAILKDGMRRRLTVLLKDGSISGEKHITVADADLIADAARHRADAFRDAMIEDMRLRSHGRRSMVDSRPTAAPVDARSAMVAQMADAWRSAAAG